MPRLKAITLAPTALDRNGISTTETLLATRLDYLINGTLSTGYDRNGIAVAQTTAASTALTLIGRDFISRKGVYVLIFAATADNTGITFEVLGRDENGNGISETIIGPDSGLIVVGAVRFEIIDSVTPSAAIDGNVEVGMNGYALFDSAQHMATYSAADDSGETVTFLGESIGGDPLTETITGAGVGATVDTTENYSRIDRITASGAGAGATEAGVNGLAESKWFVVNYRGSDFNIGFGVNVVSGTLTYAVQHTFNNILASTYSVGDETVYTHDAVTGKSADEDGNYTNTISALRLAFTAHTSGSAVINVAQSGR